MHDPLKTQHLQPLKKQQPWRTGVAVGPWVLDGATKEGMREYKASGGLEKGTREGVSLQRPYPWNLETGANWCKSLGLPGIPSSTCILWQPREAEESNPPLTPLLHQHQD